MTTTDQTPPPAAAPPEPSPDPADPPKDGRPVLRRGPRSLTSKLTLGVVSLVILLVGAIGASTYFALRSYLDSNLDRQLSSTAVQNVRFFSDCVSDAVVVNGKPVCRGGPQFEHEWVVAVDPSTGQKIEFTSDFGGLKLLQLTSSQLQDLVADQSATATVEQDGETLRVTAREGRTGLVVITGLSTDDVSRTLGRLVTAEIVIGFVAVAVALFATTFGVRFSLRRLRRVTTTAQEVASELSPQGAGLDRRVPEDEPDTEVGHLATSFNTMLAAVETQFAARLESEQRLRQFLADASHELRTPLTSIRGYAELARMQRAVGDNAPDNLDRIESEGTRMSRLVEDLLLLARGEAAASDNAASRPMNELVDVPDLLDDVVSGSRAAFPDRRIDLRVEAVPEILGDRDQLLRAIRNLVTNACVHTEAGRPITVHGFTQAGGLVVTVVDGGPGLPAEQAAHVFERFWRADKARSRASGGTGLGMSIVATIVRAHGGSVRFESSVERGSTVTLWLPAAG